MCCWRRITAAALRPRPAFLQAVRPALGVFQVGYRNRYHHPKVEVFERYREMGIGRLRTDEAGAITMHFGAQVRRYRLSHRACPLLVRALIGGHQ